MDIFMDLEFVERGRDLPIQVISIGMIRSDGTEFYRINPECLSNVAKHPWLSVNVAPSLPMSSPAPGILLWDEGHEEYQYVARSLDELIVDVLEFVRATPDAVIWAYFGHYDHVAFHQLFGSMGEQPAGVPMFTRDIHELALNNPGVELPPALWRVDHAMEDARWAKAAYEALTGERKPLMLTAEVIETDDAVIVED
jgi:hypothetical protein